jgi:propionate CoA-transferase
VLFISERAVFELKQDGVHLVEIAPGIDLKKDILAHMDFMPKMPVPPKLMDSRIFVDKVMNIKHD